VSYPSTQVRAQSLRDAHKKRTRLALREAALKLFASQGFDTTTIEAIAEKVGVASRTFFRYFPTKESVLFLRENAWVKSFVQIYRAEHSALGDVDAMCAALAQLASSFVQDRESQSLFRRIVASSPTLRGRIEEHLEETIQKVAEVIATRRGLSQPDESCFLLAEVGVVTHRRAMHAWLAQPGTPLSDAIVEEFRLLKELLLNAKPAKPARGRNGKSPERIADPLSKQRRGQQVPG
jgi:AcrR family transcriptional regulator